MSDERSGSVEALWIKPASRSPMRSVDHVDLVEGRGIEGNANRGGRRQVTLLSREAWDEVEQTLGTGIDPATRRANVLLSGIDLLESRDRVLALGACRIRIRGETRPCTLMESAHAGLREALDPNWRGGAFGEVVKGGKISVGDPATWTESGS